MKITGITLNWESLGAEFANLDDDIQSNFFNGLARELKHWTSDHNKQMQGANVASKLGESEKKELENFLSMLYYKD